MSGPASAPRNVGAMHLKRRQTGVSPRRSPRPRPQHTIDAGSTFGRRPSTVSDAVRARRTAFASGQATPPARSAEIPAVPPARWWLPHPTSVDDAVRATTSQIQPPHRAASFDRVTSATAPQPPALFPRRQRHSHPFGAGCRCRRSRLLVLPSPHVQRPRDAMSDGAVVCQEGLRRPRRRRRRPAKRRGPEVVGVVVGGRVAGGDADGSVLPFFSARRSARSRSPRMAARMSAYRLWSSGLPITRNSRQPRTVLRAARG